MAVVTCDPAATSSSAMTQTTGALLTTRMAGLRKVRRPGSFAARYPRTQPAMKAML